MPFRPNVSDTLIIDNVAYRVAEHPSAPGIPYGQEGRQAIVYQLVAGNQRRALKVFKPRYQLPALASQAEQLAPLARLPGLGVCQRTVLTARRHGELLRQHPELTYAVLMPWVKGPTWLQVLTERRELSPQQCLTLARALAEVLAGMEEEGVAHCDLSGPNVLLPGLTPLNPPVDGGTAGGRPVDGGTEGGVSASAGTLGGIALVDVEQMYGPELRRPQFLAGGSPGYAHATAPDGLWSAEADRFAGAVLLAEMLAWCDERVHEAAWGESYFAPDEMQAQSHRLHILIDALRERWGAAVSRLFHRTWHSDTLLDCPTFGEWMIALPGTTEASRALAELGSAETAAAPEADTAPVWRTGGPDQELGSPAARLKQRASTRDVVRPGTEESLPSRDHRYGSAGVPAALPVLSQGSADQPGQLARLGLGAVNSLCWVGSGKSRSLVVAFAAGVIVYSLDPLAATSCWPIMDDEVNAVVSTPEGSRLLLGTEGGHLWLWPKGQDRPSALSHYARPISCLALSPDGDRLAVGFPQDEGRILILRVPGLTPVYDLEAGSGLDITGLSFAPNGSILASGADDGSVSLWDLGSGSLILRLRAHRDVVWDVAFAWEPRGLLLATASEDATLKLWRVPDGDLLVSHAESADAVNSVAFSPDGRLLAAGGDDSLVRLWHVGGGELLSVLEGHQDWVVTTAFSPDGTLLASGSCDGTARVWGAACGGGHATLSGW